MAIQWQGGWAGLGSPAISSVSYYSGDVVSYNNISYIVQKNITIIPVGSPAPPNDMSKWDVLVAGVNGATGSSGTSGSSPVVDTFIYSATASDSIWSINHKLGTLYPLVQVYSGGYQLIPADIYSVDVNNTNIFFNYPVSGYAIISAGISGTSSVSGGSGSSGTSGSSGVSIPTGGTAGQYLVKNSSTNYDTVWTGEWIDVQTGGGMLITGSVSNPVKSANKLVDYQKYRQVGHKTYEMVLHYAHSALGGSDGTGVYLFSLPSGFQFDTTIYGTDPHTNNLGITSSTSARAVIPGSNGMLSNNAQQITCVAKVFDSTRFTIISSKAISGGADENNQVRSNWFSLSTNPLVYTMRFTFQIA